MPATPLKRNVRVIVSQKNLEILNREWDQKFQSIDTRLEVRNSREMADAIISSLRPGQYISYLFIDGHGSWYGMEIGPKYNEVTGWLHKTSRGETLAGIAKRFYGTPSKWKSILDRNRIHLGNGKGPTDFLPQDMRLIIPDLPALANVEQLRRLTPYFAAGANVFLNGCSVGLNRPLLKALSRLWGVHVSAGTANQSGLKPGIEGDVVHCFISRCDVSNKTFWGVRER